MFYSASPHSGKAKKPGQTFFCEIFLGLRLKKCEDKIFQNSKLQQPAALNVEIKNSCLSEKLNHFTFEFSYLTVVTL